VADAPVALVAGATGAVGSRLLDVLLARVDGTRVVAVGRRPPARTGARLSHVPATLSRFPAAVAGGRWDEAYCCLGTTRRAAGSPDAFRAVDLEGVVAFARAARAGGAEFLGLVSSAGANPASPFLYFRTKGEAEAEIERLGFPSLAILRPGLLRGARGEFRLGERLGHLAAPLMDRALAGPLSRFRSVPIASVAAALEAAGRQRRPGTLRLDPAAIEALATPR
jgi:uncharacterized protein YbjT (DUF2867 family)